MRISDWSSDVCSSDLRIPTQVVHAAPFLASWIKRNVARPLIIGPDLESEQWVSQVAADADAPFLVCEKIRSGDRHVRSEERRVGKECVSTCRSRWSPYH